MRRALLALAGIALVALGAVSLATLRRQAVLPPPVASAPPVQVAAREEARSSAGPRDGVLPPPPPSLADTTPDGDLAVDANGHLAPNPAALRLFDYYLAAAGEEPPDVIRARIVAEIGRRVDEPAAGEAVALLDRYLAYRAEAERLATEGAAPADLERRLQWVRELRRRHFGADTAAALFGEEERLAENALARRRVASDPALAPEERERRMEALEAELPESVRESRRLARAIADSKREVDALRARGASDAEVWAARERRFGPEAADRLAALDVRRAGWQRRLDAYRAERDALLRDPELAPLAPAEREARLEALRAVHFTPEERLRVRALEEAQSSGAAGTAAAPAPGAAGAPGPDTAAASPGGVSASPPDVAPPAAAAEGGTGQPGE